MLGRAAASISYGRIAALAFLLAVACDRPSPSRGQGPVPAWQLASFPMGPDRMPFVTLSFGGTNCHCLLDTGSFITTINDRLRTALGEPAGTVGSNPYYVLPEASIGLLRIPAGMPVSCRDLHDFETALGMPVDGIVGMNVLSLVDVSLSYDDNVVTLDQRGYRSPEGRASATMFCAPRPHTMITVSNQDVAALIDTGSDEELELHTTIAKRLCTNGKAAWLGDATFARIGRVEVRRWGLLAVAQMNSFRHKELVFTESHDNRVDVTLGRGFLARYNSTLLFSRNELMLSKSKWHDAQWWPLLRGMTIADFGDRHVVFAVRPGSDAFRAGIRPDDELGLPHDFVLSLCPGIMHSYSLYRRYGLHVPIDAKLPIGEAIEQIPVNARPPLWDLDWEVDPFALRVRKPGETEFTIVQIGHSRSQRLPMPSNSR